MGLGAAAPGTLENASGGFAFSSIAPDSRRDSSPPSGRKSTQVKLLSEFPAILNGG
jgi:hypothetical protein